MYTKKLFEEILKEKKSQYNEYKLCYIDDIDETIYDYDEESKKIINSPGFDWKKESELFGIPSRRLITIEQPNPEYKEGIHEKVAYFTPSLDLIWGDDWDDVPYEHNACIPYDRDFVDNYSKAIELEIILIPFAINKKYFFKEPKDWSCGCNSCFSVRDINNGVIPWLTIYKDLNKPILIKSEDSIIDFIEKINK